MKDRSVVTWGDPASGGDHSAVEAELKQWNERVNVQSFLDSLYTAELARLAGEYYPKVQIYSSRDSFIAVKPNHTVIQW
jgi:hypothetical protein